MKPYQYMKKTELFHLIENRVNSFAFIKTLDYSAEIKYNEDCLELYFKNTKIYRGVKFIFWPTTKKGKNVFGIGFYRLPGGTADDMFSLDEYIRNKRIEVECNYNSLEGYIGSLEERLELFFNCIEYIFNKNLIEILKGEAWEIIPMNWGTYK